MKNKFLLTVSNLSLVIVLGMQNAQAMDEFSEVKDGYYRIKCKHFAKNNPDPEGLLNFIDKSSTWGQVLHNTNDKDIYLEGATQRKDVIWHVQKVQDENVSNAYTLKNFTYSHPPQVNPPHLNAGLLSNSMDKPDFCRTTNGCIPIIVKNNDSDINSYLPNGAKRKQVLWNIIPDEGGTYKIRSLSHSQSDLNDCNEGCLAASKNTSKQGSYAEVLAAYSNSSYCKEFYFVNKENDQPGSSRMRILWKFLPISPKEMNELLAQQSSTVDIKIHAGSIQSVQVNH